MDFPFVSFGRDICGDLADAEKREWLVTNGIGGYASGTIAGHLTRRYHGLLVAALQPPLGRMLFVAKLDEFAEYDGATYPLSTNRWRNDVIDPRGYFQIEEFHLEGASPVWRYACADARLVKKIWMEHGGNTTYVSYFLERGSRHMKLQAKALVNYCDFNSITRAGDWQMNIAAVENGLRVLAFDGATPFYVLSPTASVNPSQEWYRAFDLSVERARGFDHEADHLLAGTFQAELGQGDSLMIVASTEPEPNLDAQASWQTHTDYEQLLMQRVTSVHSGIQVPAWIEQLTFAADQFIVKAPAAKQPDAHAVIAGYHWFGEWGRDTMIALPGLTLATGRPEIARNILLAWAGFVDHGMLPNRFPELDQKPEYNTVDAALWYFLAVREYWTLTHDRDLLQQVFPALSEIIDSYAKGTRYNIHVDPADGLLYAGESGVQLTWMDAKIGDWVVTPRMGKPVEVNALWLNALLAMKEFADELKRPFADCQRRAEQAFRGAGRFWNEATQCCFDVIDGPAGNDASVRPNQIFMVSLSVSPFDFMRQRAIVETVARRLLTSHGLRSLAPDDPQYRGTYAGDARQRDSAYHQGTVWGWLLGPFIQAHLRVFNDPEAAKSFLDPIPHHLLTHGLGTASEIFDGDAPFAPHGCIAQAWTTSEFLRAWAAIAQDNH